MSSSNPAAATEPPRRISSKANVAGHPLHPMLVAFPVVGYTGTLVGYSAYGAGGGLFWLNFGIAMNILGVGGALLAALPGTADAALGIPFGTPAKTVALSHGGLNIVALALFGITLGVYSTHWNGPPISAVYGIVLGAVGMVTTLAAGFLGWMLVQDYHMGVHLSESQSREEDEVQRRQVLHLPHRAQHRHAA